ncbi:hypothetical protein ACJJTC_009359 [Scirpophaga incertulas]
MNSSPTVLTPTPNPTPTASYAHVTSKVVFPKKDQAIILDSVDGFYNKRLPSGTIYGLQPYIHPLRITYIKQPSFSHVMSFRRHVYVAPEDESKLPDSIQITYEDTNYWIYITNDSLKCFICNGVGHIAAKCPQNYQSQQSVITTSLNEESDKQYPSVSFSRPRPPPLPPLMPLNHDETTKGTKRLHSPSISTPTDILKSNIDIESTSKLSVEFSDDTSSVLSIDEVVPIKKITKKKKKVVKELTEEEIWTSIVNDTESHKSYPLSIDQFRSLLDVTNGKQNIIDIVSDYKTEVSQLIDMCIKLHPQLNKKTKE